MSEAAALPGHRIDDAWLSDLSARIWSKQEFSMIPIDIDEVPRRSYSGPALSGRGERVVFCGIPSDYGTAFLLHLIEQRVNLVAVVCSTRWQRTHPKADLIARIAGHLGRPVEITANANTEAFVRSLQGYAPDVVIMASFDQILQPAVLEVPHRGWLNVHPSLLPRHRGPEPIYWTIADGDAEAGITVHLTVPRIDAGPILAQRRTSVSPDDTAGTLAKRLVAEGLDAVDETLAALQSGRSRPVPPSLDRGSYEPPVRQTELDWDQPFDRIDRLVRAGHPDQPPFFTYRGQRRFVEAVRPLRPRKAEQLGVVATMPPDEMVVAVQDAVLAARWRKIGHQHASRPLAKQQFP
ncbi:MAG: methionyl-tRNA formyltransferase [Chloroflexi bacterium]|nr:MAG: methionyl-tRNA formyltransferase [Chloroflexota bacterium]TME48066.1 MAG: methionyl-tRNA formyltransferase [Chloroflexota bacterium]